MKARIRALIIVGAIFTAFGCGPSVDNSPGKDANVKKEYSKDDALAIKPKRGGSEESGN